jgi:hypothetical protein
MRIRVLFAALALSAVLAGCSSTAGDDTGRGSAPATPAATGSIAEQQQSNGAIIPGYSVTIPKLHETSTLQALGLNPDHTPQVPTLANPMQAGIYTHGPMPGQVGPAVVLAHVNAHGQPGFGAGFHSLAAGDEVDFTTPSGPVSYKVTQVLVIPKAQYPTARVFSDTKGAEIRLETCGPGDLDYTGRNYLNQTIVFGVKV